MAEAAIAWALDVLGRGAKVLEQRAGEEADLWHLRAPRGEAWLKRHRHAAKAARERATLEHLAPHLGDAIPRVLAVYGADVLLVSACAGRPVDLARLQPEARAAVLADAGAFLRRLSDVPLLERDADPLPLPDAYALRFARWLHRAAPLLSTTQHAELAAALDPGVFVGVERRPCHRDFRPANWILSDRPRHLSVIDFGQARPDDWLVDLAKLDPSDVPRVLEGFGRPLAPDEAARLSVLRRLHELATLAWTAERRAAPAHPRTHTPGSRK